MVYKLLILLAYIWILVYNISYIVYEFKSKNNLAAWSVISLTAVLFFAVTGVFLSG